MTMNGKLVEKLINKVVFFIYNEKKIAFHGRKFRTN